MTTESLELDVLGDVTTVDDAIRQDAHLAAVADVVTTRRAALKAWVGATLARPGAKVEVDGVGQAMMTTPGKRAEVIDEDAFLAWALVNRPDATDTVERLAVGPIEHALAGDLGDDLAKRLREVLEEIPGALETQVVVGAKLAEDLRKAGTEHRNDDGTVSVVTEEAERVPGVEVRKASTPTPRLTPNKALVAHLADEITDRLAPVPTLTEESTT